jgi:[ribosomal protein S18]-alanine N-acetyltransferase
VSESASEIDEVVIRRLGRGDEALILAAGDLFDHPPREVWARSFLKEPTHHLLVAYLGMHPVGFVTGVDMVHPDKGREMFLYELGVGPRWRRRGVAKALIQRLVEVARERGCYGMWVLTEENNEGALATYTSAGGGPDRTAVLFEWKFT